VTIGWPEKGTNITVIYHDEIIGEIIPGEGDRAGSRGKTRRRCLVPTASSGHRHGDYAGRGRRRHQRNHDRSAERLRVRIGREVGRGAKHGRSFGRSSLPGVRPGSSMPSWVLPRISPGRSDKHLLRSNAARLAHVAAGTVRRMQACQPLPRSGFSYCP